MKTIEGQDMTSRINDALRALATVDIDLGEDETVEVKAHTFLMKKERDCGR